MRGNASFTGVSAPYCLSALTAALLVAGCESGSSDYFVTTSSGSLAVSDVVSEAGCSTEAVLGLAWQIARETQCLNPGELLEFEQVGGMAFGPAVLPLASPQAVMQLEMAAEQEPARTMNITSAYRAVPQQFILYTWAEAGKCGISAAATPGRSNHESGRAVDVSNFDAWISLLDANGWAHNVPGDDVHFEHLASADLRGVDVLAFQRLWNRAHPADPIGEDGQYGPQTGSRLAMAPVDGFDLPVGCAGMSQYSLEIVGRNAPGRLRPNDRAMVELTLKNVGSTTWQAGTQLTAQSPSRLVDAPTWLDTATPLALADEVPPDGEITVAFAIVAPPLAVPGVVTDVFYLRDGANAFGMVTLSMWVSTEEPGEPANEEGSLPEAENEPSAGGCQAGGGHAGSGHAGVAGLGLVLACVARRRRPARA